MSKKLTYKFVKERFEKEDYILLTTKYINNTQKLKYICPNGHKHTISWSGWRQGKRCAYCIGQGRPTIEFIRLMFKKEGYKLLSEVYVNNKTKLKYTCPKGHTHSISWNAWSNSGARCWYCFGTPRESFRVAVKLFEKVNYKLLTTEYICNKQKLSYICSEGHKHSMPLSSWKAGHRCPTCKAIKLSIDRCGSKSPLWKGGISFEPYCEVWKDTEYKADIRERDGNKCLNPYCNSKNPDDLAVHHIDYNKKSCGPENLITVCKSCNSRANKDRKWHKLWYQAVLSKRYGYKYEYSKIVGR